MRTSESGLAVLLELDALGIRVALDGPHLQLTGNLESLSNVLRARVIEAKPEILRILRDRLVAHDPPPPAVTSTPSPKPVATQEVDEMESALAGSDDIFVVVDDGGDRLGHKAVATAVAGGRTMTWSFGFDTPDDVRVRVTAGARVVVFDPGDHLRRIAPDLNLASSCNGGSLARLVGMPPKLEVLAAELFGYRVDLPNERGLHRVAACAALLRRCWHRGLRELEVVEPDLREADRRINERGFAFDVGLAEGIVYCDHVLAEEARPSGPASRATDDVHRLRQHLSELGLELPDVRRETLLRVLETDISDEARALIVTRLARSGIAGHKARAGLRVVDPDGRIRGSLVYCGAVTGRWTGRGFQPQNIPRGVELDERTEDDVLAAVRDRNVDALAALARRLGTYEQLLLASALRACVHATERRVLGIVDYRSIEPRVLLWLADDHTNLASYKGPDCTPYEDAAARVLGLPRADVGHNARALGKAMEIGCGYGMGGERFEAYAEALGVDWSKAPVSASDAVELWRNHHPLIAGQFGIADGVSGRFGGLWRKTLRAAMGAAGGDVTSVGRTTWTSEGPHVVCVLPSGRRLFYRHARIEHVTSRWGKAVATFTYERHGQRVATYGPKLVENIVQAICRDLLGAALVRLEARGFDPVLHVHDEAVCELFDGAELAELEAAFCELPDWAAGIPLQASGRWAKRYKK